MKGYADERFSSYHQHQPLYKTVQQSRISQNCNLLLSFCNRVVTNEVALDEISMQSNEGSILHKLKRVPS